MVRQMIGVGLLSAAALLLQITLTRVLSIAQFYHFAFLVISLALLGFGASGSLLALWPRCRQDDVAPWYALGFAWSALVAFLVVNHYPFDSYSIAWEHKQVYLMIVNLLGLAVPFVFVGALIGSLLSEAAQDAGRIYGVNLLGSAVGAILAPVLIALFGSERAVPICMILGAVAGLALAQRKAVGVALITLIVGGILFVALPPFLQIKPSPYKSLSHFRRNPDAETVAVYENAHSRLDIVASRTIHSAQGASLTYFGDIPPQVGLLIDGDNMLPVSDASRIPEPLLRALPVALAYVVRPDAEVIILGGGGGLDVQVALVQGARQVTIIEPNSLIYRALTNELDTWAGLVNDPRVNLQREEIRTFVQYGKSNYDIVELTLTDNYRPVSSGAFTLTENYLLTVEAFSAYLDLAGDDGLLVVNRWLQIPPSESLRVLAIVLEALDSPNPLNHLVVFRSFQLTTFIVKPTPLTDEEIAMLLSAIEDLRFDLVLAPEMPANMINQYAVIGETPIYHDLFLELATTDDRNAFYDDYAFAVSPPTDDRPFFFHFFKWNQMPDVIENLGQRWQPFGGSGYFVLIALLAFAILATLVLILLPIAFARQFRRALNEVGKWYSMRILGYFTTIGLAYLLVEVALIQQYILILGNPTLALATVIGTLLLFSGLGSLLSNRLPWRITIFGLAVLILGYRPVIQVFAPALLALALPLRIFAITSLIAPLAFLMGVPFPKGIGSLPKSGMLAPWAWAANGGASVISAVFTMILTLLGGFTMAFLVGGGLYLLAGMLVIGRTQEFLVDSGCFNSRQ